MIKKIIIIAITIILVVASSFVILNLDNSSNLIFASSINITENNFTVKKNSQITANEYGLKILPTNYNQGTTFSTSNSNIATVNENGTIICADFVGSATITISAKSSSTKSISENLTVTVENDGNVTIEYEKVEIYENSNSYNHLSTPENASVTVESFTSLIDYNYITGLISINPNHPTKHGYDKITITVTYEPFTTTKISFEVIVIKTISLTVGDSAQVDFVNSNSNQDYINTELISTTNSINIEQMNFDNFLVSAQNVGTATYTISCSSFTYKYYFIVSKSN